MWHSFLQKIVRLIDPKLEKYREKKEVEKPKPYAPKTLEDFVGVIQRTPKTVLSSQDRKKIAATMSFDEKTVDDLMVAKDKMVFVQENEVLGPLVLDKLYKSGFTNFPVEDSFGKVVGVIHTEALNALEIRKADKAKKYVDKRVNYLHVGDSLKFVVDEIIRTNGYYFLVLDKNEKLKGFFTVEMLLEFLLGM